MAKPSATRRGFVWTIGDASNPALAIAVDATSHALHICDATDVSTDWNVSADSDPSLYIHCADTNAATDYVKIYHDDTYGYFNVDGTTVMSSSSTATTIALATTFSAAITASSTYSQSVTSTAAATLHTVASTNTATSGTAAASKSTITVTGNGKTYAIANWLETSIGGNTANVHGIYMYCGNIDNKTVSNYTPIYVYVEDMGNAVSNFAVLSLETNIESSGGGTGEHCFIRFREHDTTVAGGSVFRFEGQAAGYFATFDGTPGTEDGNVMFDSATCDQTADCRFRVSVPMGGGGAAAARYIYLYPV